jgi:hypothetical protein
LRRLGLGGDWNVVNVRFFLGIHILKIHNVFTSDERLVAVVLNGHQNEPWVDIFTHGFLHLTNSNFLFVERAARSTTGSHMCYG